MDNFYEIISAPSSKFIAKLLSLKYSYARVGSSIFASEVWLFSFRNLSIAMVKNFTSSLKSLSTPPSNKDRVGLYY